ncbi:MAG TPA: protein kinase, partial [Terriglobales bacterium]|nr:protein kinase [Terriglobales bacterium]
RLERTVAIKVLPEQFSQNADLKQRFEREARAISSLNHPNICTLYDVGHHDGMDYLVLEYIEGESLAERLQKGPLPVEQTLKTGCEIAEALEKAHRQGIVHRDLKPGNVMLTKSGAKLLDFGLAKPQAPLGAASATAAAITQTSPASPITVQGTIVGTFQYMSPEQVEGKEADARSDIFALGAVLYEMATGKRAFEGKSAISVASAILEKEPEPVTTLAPLTPPALAHVMKVCLAKDPEERFQTAHDVKLQLKWIAEGGSSAVGMPAVKSARRRRREWLAWGLAAVLAAAGVTAGWRLHAPQPPEVMRSSLLLPPDFDTVGQDSSLAFSPDGRKLALELAGSDGKTKIWVRSLDSLTMQPLAGTEGGTNPTWSPDGRYLAYFAEHKLKRIDVSGGTVQTICDADDGRGIAWGPDGTIVFAPGPFSGLFQVPAAGGSPSELTHPAATGETHRLPQFLPDGEHVLFFVGALNGKDNAIRAISLKTRQAVNILKPAESGPRYVAPGYLVFLREQNLMAQPFDASRLQLSGEAVPIAEKVQFNTFRWTGSYALSETGLLAYRQQAGAGKYQITWLDLEGKELGKVGEPLSLTGLALAPDGKHAVLLLPESGQPGISKLWMYDLERGVLSRFTFGPGTEQGAQWSPDGTQVAYSADRGQGSAIYVKAASGSTPEQMLYRSDYFLNPSGWSPDGKLLAFDQLGGQNKNGALWILPMTGERKPYRLHPAATANENGAAFSPDGKWLSYQSDESGVNETYIVPFPGPGGKWQVTQGGGGGGWLGKDRFVWVTPELKLMALKISAKGADLQIGPPQPLFGGRTLPQVGPTDSTRDGKRLLASMPAGEHGANPSLVLVSHWMAELKK